MRRLLLLCFVMLPSLAWAQSTTLPTDYLRLNTGPCVLAGENGSSDKLKLTGNCRAITADAATNLELSPAADLVLGPTGADVLPNTGYTINLGALTNKYLTLHAAELWVETLVAQNTIATIGGRIIVSPTTTLTRDLLASNVTGSPPSESTTTFCVKHNAFQLNVAGVELGSKLVMESNGKFETFTVADTSIPTVTAQGDYCYTVYRNQDTSGLNDWYAGDAVVDTGKTGSGFIDLYSVRALSNTSQLGPTIVGNVRTGIGYAEWRSRWGIGNLNGLYGYSTEVYGAAFGDPDATNVTVDATNGFRIRSGITNKFVADTDGDLSIVGDLTVGTSGVVRSAAASSLTTGLGFYIAGGSTPTFRVGDPGGDFVKWDGSTLRVVGSIDGSNIDANTINVGSLNATGFGDNVIKNGLFEGETSAIGTAGWAMAYSGLPGAQSCCGTNGPGTLYFAQGDGNQSFGVYRAVPVQAGMTYRISVDTYVTSTTTAGVSIYVAESTSASSAVTYVGAGYTTPNSYTYLYLAGQTGGSFTTREFTYTVPSGVTWASLTLGNSTGSLSSSTYTTSHFDNVEMMKTLGPGHITANSITGDRIAANTITAADITAGTITTTEIAANTITAADIAASTITTTEIAANTIVAGDIASGTITGTQIAATTITASNLSVSTLSAITANAGTLTAGTITGVTISGSTINAGSGDEVVLDSSGVTLDAGGSSVNRIKWTDGSYIGAASSVIAISPNGGDIDMLGTIVVPSLSGAGADRVLCIGTDGAVFRGASNTAC
jgi:hypothetical protein